MNVNFCRSRKNVSGRSVLPVALTVFYLFLPSCFSRFLFATFCFFISSLHSLSPSFHRSFFLSQTLPRPFLRLTFLLTALSRFVSLFVFLLCSPFPLSLHIMVPSPPHCSDPHSLVRDQPSSQALALSASTMLTTCAMSAASNRQKNVQSLSS